MGGQKKELISTYYDLERSQKAVENGTHRQHIGGLWEEIGLLQYQFLIDRGLQPNQKVLDLGCGCLRVGIHLARYLHSNNYFGIDISQALLDAGHNVELGKLGLRGKVPKKNLLCDEHFQAEKFGVEFDVVFALSLFTHLPLNHIKLALHRLARCMRDGVMFYATMFLCPVERDWAGPFLHAKGGITTFPASDPYHYRVGDLLAIVSDLPFSFAVIGDWGHPRDQQMVAFQKVNRR